MPKANDQQATDATATAPAERPAGRPGSRERGADVRRRIEAAAVELIAERGWGGVSTRQLAERAGVTAGLVHYHYRSVDDALRTAVVAAARSMIDEVAEAIGEASSVDQALGLIWSAMDRHPADAPESVMMLEAMLSALRDPELREGLGGVLQDFRRSLAARLRQGGCAEPEATAAVLASTLDGVMLHRILSDEPGVAELRGVAGRMLVPDGEHRTAAQHEGRDGVQS